MNWFCRHWARYEKPLKQAAMDAQQEMLEAIGTKELVHGGAGDDVRIVVDELEPVTV